MSINEATLKKILDDAPRVVRSLATPDYWRPAGTNKDPLERLLITRAEAAWITKALLESESEIAQRELHHFETEQENADLAKNLDWAKKSRLRWKDRCVEAQRERDALRDGRTPDQHWRDRVRQLEAELKDLKQAGTFSDGYQEGFTDAQNDVAGA